MIIETNKSTERLFPQVSRDTNAMRAHPFSYRTLHAPACCLRPAPSGVWQPLTPTLGFLS